ncbi:uncharacterized protein isoform X2 [Rhodnius prolixus]|uniref:uncharacterized protein isoform X2 n=1 Tax=Rhodnius prolixus TaxID=13249 RepID=UPI003D18EFBA
MNYSGVNFFKDPLDDLSADLSDISDVKPSDLDKILKSAKDLDDEILGTVKAKNKTSEKDSKKTDGNEKKISYDDPLADFSIISDEDLALNKKEPPKEIVEKKISKDRIVSLFGLSGEEPKVEELKSPSPSRNKTEELKSKNRSSGDWLGLTASPVRPKKDIKDPNSAYSLPKSSTPTKNQDRLKITLNRSRTEGDIFAKESTEDPLADTETRVEESKTSNVKKRTNLLDDLFGSSRLKKEDSKIDKKVEFSGFSSNIIKAEMQQAEPEKNDSTYMPSLSSNRRPERKKESSASLFPTPKLGLDLDADKFMGVDESIGDKSERRNSFYNKQESTNQTLQRKQSLRWTSKENIVPDWLDGGSQSLQLNESQNKSNVQKQSNAPSLEASFNVPEWLGGSGGDTLTTKEQNKMIPQAESTPIKVSDPPQLPIRQTQPISTAELPEGNVIGQLANVQAQLGAAMARHNQNLQAYMQVLMNEAQRVAIGSQMVIIQDKVNHIQSDEKKEELKNKLEEIEEKIKQQAAIIFDQQTNITKLELQNAQLEMKIKNAEELKEMEVDKLKKEFEFEISNWENRLHRTKVSYEEIISEHEEKINRLKKKEEEAEEEFQTRLATLQAEKKADLEKLGEFHRLVMEQSALITLNHPNLPSGVKIPLRYPNKPSDEIELTEREEALIEKERSFEILKATLDAEKRDLDEALEREKVRRDEREREVSRALMELKLKEEFYDKEHKRKTEQLKELEQRLKVMRDEALKEQSEISKEKLALAAEKARLEATISLQSDPDKPNLHPMDLMKARAELEAALEVAREAREMADQERRRHVELRKAVEEIGWEQKDKDLKLEMRERHISYLIKDSENKQEEGLRALDEAQNMKEELEQKQKELKEILKHVDTKEKVLAKERLEIAKERIELDKRKSQFELLLPELSPGEDLTVTPAPKHSGYIDPKAVIMKLKAEKDLQDYIAPLRKSKDN